MPFKIIKKSQRSGARLGLLKTKRGVIKTPFFMPIATRGSVKSLESAELKKLGAQIILSNSYHLYLRPGLAVIKKSKGLHGFMNWSGPILTDSGGFQVFSLEAKNVKFKTPNERKSLVKITDKGVEFKSVYDGSKHFFTPKKVLEIQAAIGSDIRMVLDVCSPAKCSKKPAEQDLEITLQWAKDSLDYKNSKLKIKKIGQIKKAKSKNSALGCLDFLLFGIVQGALYKDLRLKSASELSRMSFDGYAIGGLAVGESPQEMYQVLDYTVPALPKDKPHYLMGVGYPEQIVEAVKRGIDMFDCVIPTREGRHGRLFVWKRKDKNPLALALSHPRKLPLGKGEGEGVRTFYDTLNIRNSEFRSDTRPVDPSCDCQLCKNYSRAFLYQMFKTEDWLGPRLATIHNLRFYLVLMERVRSGIR